MVKYAQLVVGPAGSGKARKRGSCAQPDSSRSFQSTYCGQVHAHCSSVGRVVHVVNLDPAAEHFDYAVSGDVRDLISLEVCDRGTPRHAWSHKRRT